MAYVKILVHAVWATKNHYPFLQKDVRQKIFSHIRDNAKAKQICIDRLNGATDHVHCLLWLNADISIAKTIQLIKGEASNWINKQKLMKEKFEWADEYYAASVSESSIEKVRAYIEGQEEHHRKATFAEECEKFFKEYNINHG